MNDLTMYSNKKNVFAILIQENQNLKVHTDGPSMTPRKELDP